MFTKKDIKTGMWVEFACGDIGLAMEVNGMVSILNVQVGTCISNLNQSYSEDIVYPNGNYTIMKVWAPSDNCNYLLDEESKGKLIFDRCLEAEKEALLTQKDALQKQIEELDKQLDTLYTS